MKSYRNLARNSGVLGYEIGEDYIVVRFIDGGTYLYTYSSAGAQNIEHMKHLAVAGKGLSGFISAYVKKRYEKKIK